MAPWRPLVSLPLVVVVRLHAKRLMPDPKTSTLPKRAAQLYVRRFIDYASLPSMRRFICRSSPSYSILINLMPLTTLAAFSSGVLIGFSLGVLVGSHISGGLCRLFREEESTPRRAAQAHASSSTPEDSSDLDALIVPNAKSLRASERPPCLSTHCSSSSSSSGSFAASKSFDAATVHAPISTPDVCQCVVCMDSEATHILAPCGHMCVCGTCVGYICAAASPECPMCRAAVLSFVGEVWR